MHLPREQITLDFLRLNDTWLTMVMLMPWKPMQCRVNKGIKLWKTSSIRKVFFGDGCNDVSFPNFFVYHTLTQAIFEMTQLKMTCGTYDPLWQISRLNTERLTKKSHKCCSTLTAKCSERFSVSISLHSKDFVLNVSQSASNFCFHFSKYRSKNHKDISSHITEFTPKISLEGGLPFLVVVQNGRKKRMRSFFHSFDCLLLSSARWNFGHIDFQVHAFLCLY